jgi:hypothetical protein
MDFARFGHVVALSIGLGCARGPAAEGVEPRPLPQPGRTMASPTQPQRWTGHMSPGSVLTLRTTAGSIAASPAEGDVASVEATLHDGVANAGGVPVRVVQDDRGVAVVVAGEAGGCDGDGDSDGAPRAVVDLVARVPAGVRLVARSVSGGIEARALRGAIDARSVDGAVRATFADGDPSEDVQLRTVNGAVQVTVPGAAGGDWITSSQGGDVRMDLPLSGSAGPHDGQPGAHDGQPRGHGGHSLRLRSVNGTIHVLRGNS